MSGVRHLSRRDVLDARAHMWAARIRGQMGWVGCGQPGHLVDTPYRRHHKLHPVDECKLRDLARRQLAEHADTKGTPR